MNLQVCLHRTYYADSHTEDVYYRVILTRQEDGRYQVTAIEPES